MISEAPHAQLWNCLFSSQYHLQRLSKLIPSWQDAFSLCMSKGSYSSQQRPTLFRLQSNLFLHLDDLPGSLQALQHLQCYIRLKLYCLKHSQGLHILQNLQEVNLTGNLGKIGRWDQSCIFIMIIQYIIIKDLCKWFHFSLILIKISYELAWFEVTSKIHNPEHPKVCVKTPQGSSLCTPESFPQMKSCQKGQKIHISGICSYIYF